LLAALFVVLIFVFWQWAVLRQALQGLKVLISNLYWYHWVLAPVVPEHADVAQARYIADQVRTAGYVRCGPCHHGGHRG
jgi:hypothetical protein